MDVLSCPLCGSRVEVPIAKPHERYFCKKCHTPFHLKKSGVAAIGEPPDVEREVEELKQKLRQGVSRIPVGRIVAGLGALVVVVWLAYALFGPAQPLQAAGEEAAQALAEGDVGALRSLAARGTREDVARWFEVVHPLLDRTRQGWFGRDEVTEVHVISEDTEKGQGIAGIIIRPAILGGRDFTLADPTAAASATSSPFGVETVWTLNWWGTWKLDGRATSEKLHPETAQVDDTP